MESYHLHRRRLGVFAIGDGHGSRPPNAPQLPLAPKGRVVVGMVVRDRPPVSLRGLHGEMPRPEAPSVIVDVIFAVVTGARHVARDRRSQSLGYVGGRCGRGETCGIPGKLAMLTRGAQSERPRKRGQRRRDGFRR